jgi:hypothetical protein
LKYNIYCDESCHLENDHQKVMVLGAVKCDKAYKKIIFNDIRNIKEKYNMNKFCEVKWTKVSPDKIEMYCELVEYFFNNEHLSFRAVIVDKTELKHEQFNQTHDEFYYKVYYQLLSRIVVPNRENYIYLDIKDTKGARKVRKLREVLSNDIYDFNMESIKNVQNINSKESEILQLADILIGAISYLNRNENEKSNFSNSKMKLIELISNKSGYNLKKTTFLSEEKFNLFFMELR